MAASAVRNRVILLSGCTGMAGTRVLEQMAALAGGCAAAGKTLPFRIRAAVRDPSTIVRPDPMPEDAFEARALDVSDPSTFPGALEDVERAFVLFHPAFAASLPAFFDASRDAGVKHIVMMTVMHAHTMTMLPHFKGEKGLIAACGGDSATVDGVVLPEPTAVAESRLDVGGDAPDASVASGAPPADDGLGMTFTMLRPAWFMENLTRPGIHLPDIVEDDCIRVPAGSGRVHLVHGSDVGEVVARLCADNPGGVRPHAEHLGAAYELTSDEAVTFAEMAAAMTDVLGRKITYMSDWSLLFVWHMMERRGHSLSMALLMAIEYGFLIAGGHSSALTPTVASLLPSAKPRAFRAFLEERRAAFARAGTL